MMAALADAGPLLPAMFAADVCAICAAAWLLVCVLRMSQNGPLESVLAWLLSFSILVAGAGAILGEFGGLGTQGFLAVHGAALVALAMARKGRLQADWASLREAVSKTRGLFQSPGPERLALLCVGAVLGLLGVISAWSEPETADALSYHLPRIGQWLADGRVTVLASQDDRMNFVAVVADLFSAWLLGGTPNGFRPADFVQEFGGIMAVCATIGLARETGLGRTASILAAALLFGMANVVVQFTASQNDLFTAGVFAASFFLWIRASRRGDSSVLGGVGAGLALGSKGTIFYLAPGAAVWAAAVARRLAIPWTVWRRTLAFGILGAAFFAGPGLYRNWRAYGDPLGPKEWVGALHQGARTPGDYVNKLRWNLTCTFAQFFEPHSQPPGLQGAGSTVVERLESTVPEKDPYTLYGMQRRERLENALVRRAEPDADYVSFGMVALILFLCGTLAAIARLTTADGRMAAAWSGGVVLYFVFFDFMQQWHLNAFRYYVLAAPWMAVVGAWGIERLGPAPRRMVWALVLAAAACVGWRVTFRTYQAGWMAASEPDHSLTHFVSSKWARWSDGLDPASAPLALYMPEGAVVAGFYRQPSGRAVSFKPFVAKAPPTAEEFVRGASGWVIAPPSLYLGREGRVMESVCLFGGDPMSMFSIAAFRPLRPGEEPDPVLYGNTVERDGNTPRIVRHLLLRTWDDRPVPLGLTNPQSAAVRYRLLAGDGRSLQGGILSAAGTMVITVSSASGQVSRFAVEFEPVDRQSDEPTVELLQTPSLSAARSGSRR